MVDDREIKKWIARLETEDSSWSNYEKLAVLYTVLNQQGEETANHAPAMYSAAPAPVEIYGDSEFLRAVSATDNDKAWAVMDELMDSLKIINERVYNSVMRKLGK